MATPMNVGDVVLVVVKGQMNGQACWNTFHYQLNTMTAAINDSVAIDGLHAQLDGANNLFEAICAATPDNYTIPEVVYQVVGVNRYAKRSKVPVNDAGNVGSTATTSNIQAGITRRGDMADRSNVGGIRLPAPTTAVEASSGVWEPAYRVLLDTVADEMLQAQVANLGAQIWNPVLYGPATAPVAKPITNTFYQEQVRVIGRRTVGRGI